MDGGETVTSTLFRSALGRFATGVCVVTTVDADGNSWGLTVNSFSSVSLNPPLVLFSIDQGATSHDVFVGAEGYSVNVLSADQEALSNRFAMERDTDRFAGVPQSHTRAGEGPLIDGCLCHIVCDLERAVPGGDHTILIGRVRRIAVSEDPDKRPLLYYSGDYGLFSTPQH
jgi:flavin reductase (DIM6/NTAB) family NADH-FMN oxidoreductase RutF